MGVKIVNFIGFSINMNKNNRVELLYKGDNNSVERLDIGKQVSISFENETVDFKIKESASFGFDLKTYSKDLMFLVSEPNVKQALKELYKQKENHDKEFFVVRTIHNFFIGEKVDNIDIDLDVMRNIGQQEQISDTSAKEDLKAYETPTNIYDIIFSLNQKEYIKNLYIHNIANEVFENIKSLVNENISLKLGTDIEQENLKKLKIFLKDTKEVKLTFEAFLKSKYNPIINDLDILTPETKSILPLLESMINKVYPNLFTKLEALQKTNFPFKLLSEDEIDKIPAIPFIDLQAGSGKGILTSATNNNFPMILQGTELRSLDNLGINEATIDPRYNVLNEVNSLIHMSDIKKVFHNGSLIKAVLNTPVYLNPPYNTDNLIAKESVEALKHRQLVYGLFPTSMKTFLNENLNGHIFEINKKLSGYTDAKVPETLLFVIGRRYDADFIEEQMEQRKSMGGSVALASSFDKHKVFFKNISADNVDDAIVEISRQINMNDINFSLKTTVESTYQYYNITDATDRQSMLMRNLKNYVNETRNLLQDFEKVVTALKDKSEDLRSEFGSENMLTKDKVFPDVQFYSKDSKTKYLDFYEVMSNKGLLVAYRDNYPEILNLLKQIAKKVEYPFEISESVTAMYDLDNPFKPTKRDKKVSPNIGLMKNYYIPSSFSLKSIENKNHLKLIVSHIYRNQLDTQLSDKAREELNFMIDNAEKLVSKLQSKIKDDKKVLKEDALVFLDEDDIVMGKLNISKTDFNKALETLGYFDIKDYIELAEISNDKKAIVMENFLKHLENTIALLDTFNNKPIMPFLINGLNSIMKLRSDYSNGKIVNPNEYNIAVNHIYVKFMNESRINAFFEKQVSFDSRLAGQFEKAMLKNEALISLSKGEKSELISKIFLTYKEAPLDFFDFKRADTESLIEDLLLSYYKKSENNSFDLEKMNRLFKTDIFNSLSQDYIKYKAVFEGSLRLSQMLISNYGYYLAKKQYLGANNLPLDFTKLYDEIFEKIALDTMGLMKHQFKTAERFTEIADSNKQNMKLWEMRAGKSLSFLMESYLLSLIKENDSYVLLESKNVDDISLQLLSHLPHLFASSNFYLTDSKIDKAVVSSENSYSHLVMSEIYPNLPNVLKPYFLGRGEMVKAEMETFALDFELLIERVKKEELTKANILENYKDSKFLGVMNLSCMAQK